MPTIQVKDASGTTVYLNVESGAGTSGDPYVLASTSTRVGALTETAPSGDTDSSGLNGRLQRVAQRLTALIALLPSSIGQKARAASLAVALSSEDVTALTAPVVTATDLDIRDLSSATDSVAVTDGGGSLTVDGSVGLAASEAHLGEVGGRTRVISATLTRPADTAAYAAGDAVTNSTSAPSVITFDDCARVANGSGVIVGVTMVDSANQSTPGVFELWLFDTAFTADNDNSAFTPTDAECTTVVGIVPFALSYVGDATSGAGGNRVYIASNLNIPFQATGGGDSLYGAIVVRNAYTPVSGETFTARLRILQD